MEKCKILFLAANPQGTTPLGLDKEIREIEAKIRAAEHRDSLALVSKWAVRPDDLLQALLEVRPHIVHFSGHGTESELVLMGSDDRPKPAEKEALAYLFGTVKDRIRLVLLNACFSRQQAELMTQHLDCVVGMNKPIGDAAAIVFAASFYRAIGFGRSVQEAFEQGIAALKIEGIPEDATPELLARDGVDPYDLVLVPRKTTTNEDTDKAMSNQSNRSKGGEATENAIQTGDQKISGGFHFGSVGRDVNMKAGGDIVAGDKVTTTHAGFDDQSQKQEFLKQMDQLRLALREIKSQLDAVEEFDEDAKDQLVMEILQQVSELKQAKQQAEQLEPGQSPSADKLQSVGQCLDKAGGLLDKIKGIGNSAAGIAETVAPILAKALPILASARHLLGIP